MGGSLEETVKTIEETRALIKRLEQFSGAAVTRSITSDLRRMLKFAIEQADMDPSPEGLELAVRNRIKRGDRDFRCGTPHNNLKEVTREIWSNLRHHHLVDQSVDNLGQVDALNLKSIFIQARHDLGFDSYSEFQGPQHPKGEWY